MKSWKMTGKILPLVSVLVYFFLWVSAIVLIVYSFSNDSFGIRWSGFTLRWYSEVFKDASAVSALKSSLFISSVTVIVSTIAGTLAAYGLYKYKFRGRSALRMAALLPITIPYVVTAGALLVFFTKVIHIPLGYPAIIIAHISFSTPLAVFVVLGRMARIDWTLEEASADLGAGTLTTLRKVTVPLLLPAIISSAALIFPWSFNDFTITYFVSGVGTMTLPIYVFSLLQYSLTPAVINAISALFVIVPLIGLLLLNFLQKKEAV